MVIAAFHPDKVFDWALENSLVFCLFPLVLTYRVPFSDLS